MARLAAPSLGGPWGEASQGPVAPLAAAAPGHAPAAFRLLKHLRDGGARQDVVELLKQQTPPLFFPRGGPLRCWGRPEERFRQVGLAQQPFEAAVMAFLIGTAGGTAPVQFQVELIAPDRQLGRQRL